MDINKLEKFDMELKLKCKCGSENVHIVKQLDFGSGVLDDCYEYTGNIVLICQDCRNKELIKLKYEMVY